MPVFQIKVEVDYRGRETVERKLEFETAKEAEEFYQEMDMEAYLGFHNVRYDISSYTIKELTDEIPRCHLTKDMFS